MMSENNKPSVVQIGSLYDEEDSDWVMQVSNEKNVDKKQSTHIPVDSGLKDLVNFSMEHTGANYMSRSSKIKCYLCLSLCKSLEFC